MAWYYNNRIIRVGRKWIDDEGGKHLYTWASTMSDAEKAALGITWVDDPEPYDNRFYWGRDAEGNLIERNIEDVAEVDEEGNPVLDEDGEQVITRGLKYNAIELLKHQAGSRLSKSDWMVIKATEVEGYSVPAEVTTYRAAVRQASNDIEAVIAAVTTHADFMALYDTPVDEEGNPIGNAPIVDFPEEI